MSQIRMNFDLINQSNSSLNQSIMKLSSVSRGLSQTKASIDPKILNRRGINTRLIEAKAEIQSVEVDLERLHSFVGTSVGSYQNAEKSMTNQSSQLEDKLRATLDEYRPSKLYDLYNDYYGPVDDMLTALMYSGNALLMSKLGIQFVKDGPNMYSYKVADTAIKNLKLPTGKIFNYIEQNPKLNKVAKFLVRPTSLFMHKDKNLSDLIYRKYTNHYPKDIVKFTNNLAELRDDYAKGRLWTSLKSNAGQLTKTSFGFVKGNAITALVISGATEGIGAGIKISENYAIYGNDIEKLQTENAKIVGEAVYKTGVSTVTSTAGAVVGGAALSFMGPIGTVVGASIGGAVGSFLGDQFTKLTPGVTEWVQDKFVQHKETIHKGIEFVADGGRAIKNGIKDVADNVSGFLNKSKNLLSNLSFG